VIDVGTNFDENGRMCGDADFEDLKESAAAVSPVPGGVGPVTLACLLEASVRAAELAPKTAREGIILT
ncbi:MAG: bifunctional methylenetetrahydrofolate dehydrogenase/methenyltetrahydrofolate cyclohydrolase, partial [Elusimicrobiota bacterium]|nr:bifunctional methylenetetrahydrofolate dehydrogenase/methenyltetrahydrofolate cyclohydrolase [Elusimicrobiota bacterium]